VKLSSSVKLRKVALCGEDVILGKIAFLGEVAAGVIASILLTLSQALR
jgi:hypothetical protein